MHIAREPLPRSDTIIRKTTKIDVLVEAGHVVGIGKHCLIVALTVLCGHVKLGDCAQLSSLVSIREGVTVGRRVLVGTGSLVLKGIPDGVVVFGSPAKPIRENVSGF